MTLHEEVKDFIEKNFGVYSAAKIDAFANEFNPVNQPKEFLDKCADFVGTLLGQEAANERFREFYEKYT
ncbi:MAG: hypothetical protein ACOCZ6_05845 [Nanoarchaeota archaeon]